MKLDLAHQDVWLCKKTTLEATPLKGRLQSDKEENVCDLQDTVYPKCYMVPEFCFFGCHCSNMVLKGLFWNIVYIYFQMYTLLIS